eukprot:2596822-Prorocentrum_lima.AAC.1
MKEEQVMWLFRVSLVVPAWSWPRQSGHRKSGRRSKASASVASSAGLLHQRLSGEALAREGW